MRRWLDSLVRFAIIFSPRTKGKMSRVSRRSSWREDGSRLFALIWKKRWFSSVYNATTLRQSLLLWCDSLELWLGVTKCPGISKIIGCSLHECVQGGIRRMPAHKTPGWKTRSVPLNAPPLARDCVPSWRGAERIAVYPPLNGRVGAHELLIGPPLLHGRLQNAYRTMNRRSE